MAEPIRAEQNTALRARILSRRPLLYVDGADDTLDRPAHVRAGSSIRWLGERLVVIQDDANFIAIIDPAGWSVTGVTLPAGPDGMRQFNDLRGNKHHKMDLEACVTVRTGAGELLIAFGSGSSAAREQIVLLRAAPGARYVHEVLDAGDLYLQLRGCTAFSGSELNIEGAVSLNGTIRLFNRGNGAPRGGTMPVDATCDLEWEALHAYLTTPDSPPPSPANVVQYELGVLDGIRLTFTDSVRVRDRVLYTAAAEDSPDAVHDGEVVGSALGVFLSPHELQWTELRDRGGGRFTGKIEGICESRIRRDLFYVVVDVDDPRVPTELCEVQLTGLPGTADGPSLAFPCDS
ncbi:hypothetical protein BH23GEM3_BH23GEM3_15590 [soil metagenome]